MAAGPATATSASYATNAATAASTSVAANYTTTTDTPVPNATFEATIAATSMPAMQSATGTPNLFTATGTPNLLTATGESISKDSTNSTNSVPARYCAVEEAFVSKRTNGITGIHAATWNSAHVAISTTISATIPTINAVSADADANAMPTNADAMPANATETTSYKKTDLPRARRVVIFIVMRLFSGRIR